LVLKIRNHKIKSHNNLVVLELASVAEEPLEINFELECIKQQILNRFQVFK